MGSLPVPIEHFSKQKLFKSKIISSWIFITEDYRYTSIWLPIEPLQQGRIISFAQNIFLFYWSLPSLELRGLYYY